MLFQSSGAQMWQIWISLQCVRLHVFLTCFPGSGCYPAVLPIYSRRCSVQSAVKMNTKTVLRCVGHIWQNKVTVLREKRFEFQKVVEIRYIKNTVFIVHLFLAITRTIFDLYLIFRAVSNLTGSVIFSIFLHQSLKATYQDDFRTRLGIEFMIRNRSNQSYKRVIAIFIKVGMRA